jgi:MFS family permease
MTESAAPRPASLWRHADFLKLLSAQTVSLLGSQVSMLALPLTAILLLRATPLQVGLLGAAQYLPFLLVGLPAGAWVDRLPRRPVLIVADVGRFVILLSVPITYAAGALSLWLLYPVAFAAGLLTVFFDVAHQSYLPSLVSREQLVDGNSKLEVSYQGSLLAGPGLGGILVQLLSAPVAVLADALSFAGSAVLLLLIRRPEAPPSAESSEGSLVAQIREGLRYVLGNDLLRAIAAATAISNLFDLFGMVQAVLLIYAVRELHMASVAVGLALGVANVGGLLGALANSRLVRWIGAGPAITLSALVPGIAVLLLVVATPATAVFVVSGALAFAWFSVAVYNVNQVSLRQAITPEAMQGRMNATIRFIIWGTIPIGTLLGGVLGSTIGLRPTLIVAGVGSLLQVLPMLFSRMRTLRELPGPEPAPGAAAATEPAFDG